MEENKESNNRENSRIDIKTTFSNLVKEEVPEMTQEEAIKNYREDDTIREIKKSKKDDDNTDNTEESEHLKRIKQELLASLERVKQFAKKLYGEDKGKTGLKIKEKSGKHQTKKMEQEEKESKTEKTVIDKERE